MTHLEQEACGQTNGCGLYFDPLGKLGRKAPGGVGHARRVQGLFRDHIPLAHHIKFDTLRGTDAGVPVQNLPQDLTKALLQRTGVSAGRTHLIYATGEALPIDEILSASMVAYVLEKFGITDIRIVDGGLPAWKAAGYPVTQEYFGNPPGTLPAKGNPDVAVAVDEVIKKKDLSGVVLVDARPANEFAGADDVWVRKGHIPGAVSFHWARLVQKDNTHAFRPFAEVKAELEAAGITPDKEVLCYCGTSREGSLLRFYLKHVAGYPKVRLYEGAWKEYAWIKDKSLPAVTGAALGRSATRANAPTGRAGGADTLPPPASPFSGECLQGVPRSRLGPQG